MLSVNQDILIIIRLLNSKGRIYYKEYRSVVDESDTALSSSVFPSSLFYELPCYSADDDIYVLTTDVESYLREYYYIRSLYGSVLEFCRENTDYILREELQEFIEFFTRFIPIATILTVSLKSDHS